MANPLIAFALVAEEYEKSGDPIKGLAPLFIPILKRQGEGNTFDAGAFAHDFSVTYGLEMSEFVARSLTERMREIHLLESGEEKEKFVIATLGDVADFDEGKIVETVDAFVVWAEKEVTNFGRPASRQTLEQAFLSRLARPEFSSAFLGDSGKRDNSLIRILLGKTVRSGSSDSDQIYDYLVARFIVTASEQAPDVFAALASIAFGSLIADAVSGLAGHGVETMPEPPLRVAIDGPLILDILGMNDEPHQVYAEGLFEIMRKAGVRLATFDHVIDEVRDSIRSVLKAFATGTEYGPLGQRLRQQKGYSIFATSVADTLDDRIKELGIAILPSQLYERADFKKFFTDEQFDRLRNAIGDVHHQVDRRIRDTKSVATVIRLKKENRKPNSVFEAGTVFITRNAALQRKVNQVLSEGRSEPDPRFTIATDAQIGGTFWFSLGSAADYGHLSQQRLIANCASAMIPHREVIKRITEFLEQTDPRLLAEFSTLMKDKRASLCPMRMTAGLIDKVDSESSLRMLQAMREEIVAPVREELASVKIESAIEKQALQESLSQSKSVSSTLQQIVSEKDDLLHSRERGFNEQLAQMSIEIEDQKIGRRETEQAISKVREKCIAGINSEELSFVRDRAKLARVFQWSWFVLCVIATSIPILGSEESIRKYGAAIVLLLVSALPLASEAVKNKLEVLSGFFFRGRQARLHSLRSQLADIESISP